MRHGVALFSQENSGKEPYKRFLYPLFAEQDKEDEQQEIDATDEGERPSQSHNGFQRIGCGKGKVDEHEKMSIAVLNADGRTYYPTDNFSPKRD